MSVEVDISYLYEIEARIPEVASVTLVKAPELLASLNVAYAKAARDVSLLKMAQDQASKRVSQAKAVVLLDRAPAILREKGLTSAKSPSGSEDLRQAVLDMDADYILACDELSMAKAYGLLIQGKLKAIEMAYTSVKKILGESSSYQLGGMDLNAGSETEDGFKKSRYK